MIFPVADFIDADMDGCRGRAKLLSCLFFQDFFVYPIDCFIIES